MFSSLARSAATLSRSPVVASTLQSARSAVLTQGQRRFLNIHEYQSKQLLRKHGVNIQKGDVANSAQEAAEIAKGLTGELIVKAQIHAGGRGLGVFDNGFKSGVHFAQTPEEVADITGKMIGNKLITKQTGKDGKEVSKVLVLEAVDISDETYFAIVMDRTHQGPVMVASAEGGVDIEKVAEETPDKIFTEPIDITTGVRDEQVTRLANGLGLSPELVPVAADQMKRLYDLFLACDATQVEINPLAVTNRGLMCVDAKINFDDNAQFRQEEVFAMRDVTEEDPREVAASAYDLNYIGLDGNIGCMVNGAGLAMATMDIIELYGGTPANFLDVGGGAQEDQVREAFKILQNDSNVKAILVNIFGGIMRCDIIAEGIVGAAKELGLKIPLVVRLSGTNSDLGKKILEDSGLDMITADDLDDAAKKAVASV
eukprot:TRINITY_DN1607_c3_g1_i2.p1 TRINITY_DN1607_c3_g1~~TRINITY_DN1607_c3_g1_i2.p1  ORF type:complete len:428 (-),score=156.64 TRINITY_DN1607_c3_g1_i2:142-1425(-)